MIVDLLNILGIIIIWLTIDFNRPKEKRFKMLTADWFIHLFVIACAIVLIKIK